MPEHNLSSKNIDALVTRAQAGDATAYGELYDALVAPIYRYTYYRVSTREDAEDLTEIAFLRGWENLKKYKKQAGNPFSAWLFRIAHNLVVDYYRTKPRNDTTELDETWATDTRDASPALLAEMHFDQLSLRRAIHLLPEAYQQIVVLKFINEFDNTEIAKIIGKSAGAVRILQFRALARLKELLTAEETAGVDARLRKLA